MKKAAAVAMVFCIMLMLQACGGDVRNVEVIPHGSDIYSSEDIDDAIDTVKKYFKREFAGCTLTEIEYAGDGEAERFDEITDQFGGDEAIVLISSFDVDGSGGDGSLEPDSTYTYWEWLLVRDEGGEWRHVDHGYY